MTRILAPGQRPETGTPPLRKARLALYVQSAVALLCVVLLFGGGSVHTVFAVVACVAALGNVLLAVRLPAQPAGVRRVALWVSWWMIPVFIVFSVPAPPALLGLASSAAVLAFLRPRFGRLRPRSRKLWLTLHVGFSVGWLGAAMAMLVLAIVGASTSDLLLRHHAYEIMHIFDLAIVIPLVLLALITGLVMSLGTKWGLVRYWWVLAKFVIALSIPLFAAVQESFWVREAVAGTRANPAVDLAGTDVRLWVCFIAFSLLLWTATALSSYKPWGHTWWYQRPLRAREPQSPA
ncbi:MAG: hypothetical protein ACRDST_18340 [Pseudonocardiaceae bacterium]